MTLSTNLNQLYIYIRIEIKYLQIQKNKTETFDFFQLFSHQARQNSSLHKK